MSFLEALSENPAWFHYLRKLPELNYRATKKLIREEIPKGIGQVLDVGCGTGEFCRLFSPGTYTGIDIHGPYIDFASKRYPEYSFCCGDARSLDLEDDALDFVLINGVVHHLDDEAADSLLCEVSRVLASDGTLLLIEDIPAKQGNLAGSFMHAVDRGSEIREPGSYQDLLDPHFECARSVVYRSGICDYVFFRLLHRSQ